MPEFDIILVMDWLTENQVIVDFQCRTARNLIDAGCLSFLASISVTTVHDGPYIADVEVVRESGWASFELVRLVKQSGQYKSSNSSRFLENFYGKMIRFECWSALDDRIKIQWCVRSGGDAMPFSDSDLASGMTCPSERVIELGEARSAQFDACFEDERQYRSPHLPAGLWIDAMS
ncbi:hypothetical protein F511_24898 [Dorcoceras hygrometricum]|uniref:Uncharacterized protein n=1 Tax=Dorcoceras hygrometricum TaxID=472368 RepID=A0A2Z7BK18_9LAMI|nr:hypothetical protein F511_24898 [Dorcoceras hygrometricum]